MKNAFGCVGLWLLAGVALAASDTAPIGSPDFYPSPAHPIGWRGDGSGRFPGATPPATWSRRIVGITSEIVVQAAKPNPNGKPGAGSHGLEYFTVKDWLVAGPFPAADPEKDLDNDFLGGEAAVQPDAGAKAGAVQWKAHRACEATQSYHEYNSFTCSNMWVDFVKALGTQVAPEKPYANGYGSAVWANLDKQAAYAHTYLYSPRASNVDIDIIHDLPAVKIWVNGAPQRVVKFAPYAHAPLKIHLNEGWNRLLVKAICDKAQSKANGLSTVWRFAAYIMPTGSNLNSPIGMGSIAPTSYETKNIAWMTKLTGRSAAQPIVVGDNVFVASGATDLLCIEKSSGKIRWLHTGTYWDAMTAEERAAVKDKAAPLLADLEKANTEIIALLNANITPQGLDSTKQAVVDKKLAEREIVVKKTHDALATGQKGKLYLNEVSAANAAPSSDGKQVYWMIQGGGGFMTSAFDLKGALVWSRIEFPKSGAGEHGAHRSPLLCDGKLIVSTNDDLIAEDVATGKVLWRTAGASHQHGIDGSPIVVQVNGHPALQTSKDLVSLTGEVIAPGGYSGWGCYVPIVEDGILYNSCHLVNWTDFPFEAVSLSKKAGAGPQIAWSLPAKTVYGPVGDLPFQIASPVYVDGLIYQVDGYGHLAVVDTKEKKLVYQRWMDGYNWNNRFLYGYCASPTLAGKNIYLLDDAGYMTILKPGAEGTVAGNCVLENLTNLPGNGPCRQEVFYAGMFFEGKRIFLHGDEYLYCIEGK